MHGVVEQFVVDIPVASWGIDVTVDHPLIVPALGVAANAGACIVDAVWMLDGAGLYHPEVPTIIQVKNAAPSAGHCLVQAFDNSALYIALGITPVSYRVRFLVQLDRCVLGQVSQAADPTPLGPAMWSYGGGGGGVITPVFLRPLGCSDVDDAVCTLLGITPRTIEVDEEARAMYLGPAPAAFTAAQIGVDIYDEADGPTWCEVGLLKGVPTLFDGPSALTLVGYADTTTDWSVPGPVATSLSGLTIAAGDHLWFAWSVKDGGPGLPSFRATLPDAILSGLFVFSSGVRLSTMAPGTNFNRCGAAERGARSVVGCS